MLSVHVDALSCAAKIVAARLALHHNIEREQCNPSIRELVLGTGMSESTVRRAVRELEQKGWLSVTRTSGGHRFSSSNSFELRAPPLSVMAGATPVTRDSGQDSHPCHARHPTPVTGDTLPLSIVTPIKENLKAKDKSEERDSLQLDLDDEDSGRRRQSHSEIDSDFEQFYRQYPRHAAKAAALKAYRGVISKGLVTAAELEAGAMRYAAERSGQDPKFTKHPSTWLNGACWADEPVRAITSTIDGAGNPIRPPPDRPQPANAHAARAQIFIDRLKAQTNGGGQ